MQFTFFEGAMLALSTLIILLGAGVVWLSRQRQKTRQFFDLESGRPASERRRKISINDEVDVCVDHVEGDHVIVEVDAPGRVHVDCREEFDEDAAAGVPGDATPSPAARRTVPD